MTTATMIRVPVRTWQEKSILTAAIGAPLLGLHESQETYLGFLAEQLYDSSVTDSVIDDYLEESAPIAAIQELLFALRAITPGPDAVLEVSSERGLLERLAEVIEELGEEDVSRLNPHVKAASQREIAEALITAIDLLDDIVGGGA